jgi:hypothetical protein
MSNETSAPTAAEQVAARGYAMSQIAGRGMFYGEYDAHGKKRVWTEIDWDTACVQAKSWGMSIVHPKVADGGIMWGDGNWLQMLKTVASHHGLKCYPYNYCYGNKFGALTVEAGITIALGKIFGGVCPDMEVEFEQSKDGAAWATQFGKLVRAQFNGPVLPTLFAANASHPGFPYEETLLWSSGWMPMVYYDEWTDAAHKPMTAQEAIYFLYPQWSTLNKQLASHGIFPPPILPLIELGNHLPVPQAASWLQQMQGYGYCGMWYDGTYAPYADAILKAPEPAWNIVTTSTPPITTPVPPVAAPITPIPSTPTPAPSLITGMQQNLSNEDLEVSWSILDATIPFDLSQPVVMVWSKLTQVGYGIGAPIGLQVSVQVNGLSVLMQPFEGGRIYYQEKERDGSSRVWVQFATQPRIPGTPVSAA